MPIYYRNYGATMTTDQSPDARIETLIFLCYDHYAPAYNQLRAESSEQEIVTLIYRQVVQPDEDMGVALTPNPEHYQIALYWADNGRKENLTRFDLRGADLRAVDLQGANLSGANLEKADLREINLSEADLRYAILSEANLYIANMEGANLQGATLIEACLHMTTLSDTNLCDADLRNADLRDTDLKNAELTCADLRGANLQGAILHRASILETRCNNQTIWPTNFDPQADNVELVKE